MYKIIIAIICCFSSAYACDFCGGATATLNNDLLSLQPQSSIGITTNYKAYKYYNNENNLQRTHMTSATLVGAYAPKKWIELKLLLPFVSFVNKYTTAKDKTFGLSDMSINANFRAVSRSPIGTTKKVGHVLVIGFGIELPTGSNNISSDVQLQNFTLGSRSVDFNLSAIYSLSYHNWSFITAFMSKVNTANKEKIRYGHLYSFLIGTTYTKSFKKFQLLPNAGLNYEIQQKNLHKNIIQKYSGSQILALQYGTDFMVKKWNIGFQVKHPLTQQIAHNTIKQSSSFLVKCTYIIKRNKKSISNN